MILITMGDPNGIGPELICRVFSKDLPIDDSFLIIGPKAPLEYFCNLFSIDKFWIQTEQPSDFLKNKINLYSKGLEDFSFTPGVPSKESGLISGKILEVAIQILKKKKAYAVVTCPINKKSLMDAGFNFPGHTEFFANRFGLSKDDVCMHLCGPKLKVSLVTTHPPLREVPSLITRKKILRCLTLTHEMLIKLGEYEKPIGVCGLNPHAGEGGKIGSEEIEVIGPAIESAKKIGINVMGPYPADTLFHRAYIGEFSAVLAMYHDQGLGPLKLVHFNESVNVTLGLPIIRTSVDHGTAYDLVGKGMAKTESLIHAIKLASRLWIK
ncbi:hypothetical protein JCM13304A_12490 [Desulfothermus okinawensis JCM 13304]